MWYYPESAVVQLGSRSECQKRECQNFYPQYSSSRAVWFYFISSFSVLWFLSSGLARCGCPKSDSWIQLLNNGPRHEQLCATIWITLLRHWLKVFGLAKLEWPGKCPENLWYILLNKLHALNNMIEKTG